MSSCELFIVVIIAIVMIVYAYFSYRDHRRRHRLIDQLLRSSSPMKRICKEHSEYTTGCRLCPFGYHDE